MLKYIWSNKKSGLTPLSQREYYSDLRDCDYGVAKRAFKKAWEIRNFEIEMYWKRATYFWAFIASTFVGYFALISSGNYLIEDKYNHIEAYFLICIGFVLSCAWHFTNVGSKAWQRHWEVHVDLLEDRFTGPLYKTVYPNQTFSVSKINEIVSFVFIGVWFILGVKYFHEQNLIRNIDEPYTVNLFVIAITALTFLALLSMVKGHGRGRFGDRPVVMNRRSVSYSDQV